MGPNLRFRISPQNSPGQRPKGVLDNQHVGFWLYPPHPPQQATWLRTTSTWSPSHLLKPSGDCFFPLLDGFLRPSKRSTVFAFDFSSKNLPQFRFLASQTPSKTHPKATPNRYPKNMSIFAVFSSMFI